MVRVDMVGGSLMLCNSNFEVSLTSVMDVGLLQTIISKFTALS